MSQETKYKNSKIISEQLITSLLFVGLIAFACYQAYSKRFVQDDAFISFRYAKNLALGYGLVFNPFGERVEGYTNFLYTLIMVLPHYFSWSAIEFSYLVSGTCWLSSLAFSYLISRVIFKASTNLSLCLVAFLSLNQTFYIYATGGLETSLVCFFVLASFFFLFHPKNAESRRTQLLASIAALCALLSRLDAGLLLLIFGACFVAKLFCEGRGLKDNFKILLSNVGPALIVFLAYMFWKYQYYGEILPNTFYAKLGAATSLERGSNYLLSFYRAYFFWLAGLLVLFALVYERLWLKEIIKFRFKHIDFAKVSVFFAIVVWSYYVVRTGGDFMEYRFFVCLLPFICFFILLVLQKLTYNPSLQVALFAIAIPTSYLNYKYEYKLPAGVESRDELVANIASQPRLWITVGRQLEAYFKTQAGLVIATSAAGAIPYYSNLHTIDTLGLNDAWVARNGILLSNLPGHQRMASLDYLLDRHVDFILGSPQVFSNKLKVSPDFFTVDNLNRLYWLGYDMRKSSSQLSQVYAKARIVKMPVGKDNFMFLLWLSTESESLQKFVLERGWQGYKIKL